MAREQTDRAARAAGDVNRSRLAPLAGGLLGAGIALSFSVDATTGRVSMFATDTFSMRGEPVSALHALVSLVVSLTVPLLIGALVGAFAAGLLQTRGYFGRGAAALPEPARPGAVLALFGWAALALLVLDLVRAGMGLAVPASPVALARAGVALGRDLTRAFFIATAALAVVDHLLRARARRARLDAAEAPGGRRPAAAREEPGPSVEALLTGVDIVLFEGDVAVTFGSRGSERWAYARARGLSARALLEAARRRRLLVRAVRSAESLESMPLGAPLSASQAAELERAREGGA